MASDQQPAPSPARTLASVSLVLGAGVSFGLVPMWSALTETLEAQCGSRRREDLSSLPNALPLRLELAFRDLQRRVFDEHTARPAADKGVGQRVLDFERDAEVRWIEMLRAALYAGDRAAQLRARGRAALEQGDPTFVTGNATLDALVSRLVDPACASRVARVITFNADDWLEFALCCRLGRREFNRRFRVVSQPTFGADQHSVEAVEGESEGVDEATRKIPLVHAHGLLCHPEERNEATHTYASTNQQERAPSLDAPNMLVFRDLDYWQMTATPASFSNHMLLAALNGSVCLFVGLSMTDINLMRWLGTLRAESEAIWRERFRLHFYENGGETLKSARAWMARTSTPHLWISDDRSATPGICEALALRGVQRVPVNWGASATASDAIGSLLEGFFRDERGFRRALAQRAKSPASEPV